MKLYDYYLSIPEVADLLGLSVPGVHKITKELGLETKYGTKHKILPSDFDALKKHRGIPRQSRKVVSMHNIKGGVGKTSISNALAIKCAMYGMRTLVIDADKQANLSDSFGLNPDNVEVRSIYSLVESFLNKKKKKRKWTSQDLDSSIFQLNEYLDIIPADIDLANLDLLIWRGTSDLSKLLKNLLAPVEDDYDLILIDLPPDFNRLTFCANTYANTVVMPVTLGRFAIKGIDLTMEHLNEIESDSPNESRERIIILNRFDARHTLKLSHDLSKSYSEYLFSAIVPVSNAVTTAADDQICIWSLTKKKCPALEGIEALANHIAGVDTWKEYGGKISRKSKKVSSKRREVRNVEA